MQVRVRATGNFNFGGGTGGLVRGALLAGVAYGAMAGVTYAQDLPQPDYCAEPVEASNVALCDVAQGSMLLDRITVVSRTGETPIESMASVSQIDAETLARRMPSTANDVFFGVPGVAIQTDARRAGSAANIRGLQDFGRVQVIVDGARQNFSRSGHGTSQMFFVDPNLLESVEVIRGPVANTYGSGAIGGVVMYNTKTADTFLRPSEQYALETTLSFDSNATGITSSTTGAVRLTENFDVLGNIVFRDFGQYTDGDGNAVDGTDFNAISGLLKATVRPTENSELNLAWSGLDDGWEESSGTSAIDVYQNTFTAQYELVDPDNPMLDLHINGSFNTVDMTSTTLVDRTQYSSETGLPITIPAGSDTTYDLTTYGLDIWNTSRFDTGAIQHELTYGGDWVFDEVVTDSYQGGSDVYTPSGDRTVWGAYIQDKLTYDWLEVIGSVRYDSYSLESDENSASGDSFSPRLTVGVSPFAEGPLSGLQVYGTYAEGYRSPSTTETLMSGLHPSGVVFPFLPNPDLLPETATTWEFGVNYALDGFATPDDSLRLKAAYFDNSIDDYIGSRTLSPFDPTSGCTFVPGPGVIPICYQYDNFAEAEISGFELEALYDQQTWFAGLGASVIEGHTIEGGVETPLASIPTTQVTGQAGVRLLEGALTIGGEVQHNWMPEGVAADDYTLVNLFASYEATEDVSFNLRVDNLFDVQYANPLSASTTSPVYEPGFSLTLGATVRF